MLIDIVIREDGLPDDPHFEQLLAVSNYRVSTASLDAKLCELMGISRQVDWPIAAVSRFGESSLLGLVPEAEGNYWLMAHPVHLVLQRDYFSLYPLELTQIPESESLALMQLLNQHFSGDGLQFMLSQHIKNGVAAWYLKLAENPEISTTLPELAAGRDIRQHMPQGRGMAKWHGILNEIQMLLHDHAINQSREQAGRVPINSIWLSGGGLAQLPRQTISKVIYAKSVLMRGLASMHGLAMLEIPENGALFSSKQANNNDDILLEIHDAMDAQKVDFNALLQALRRGRLKTIRFQIAYQGQLLEAEIKGLDTYKFWRKPKPVSRYFKESGF